MTAVQISTYEDLLWPTLKALENKGGSASNQELSEEIASYLELSDDVLDVLHNDGPLSKVEYRGAWARTHLKFIGAIDNTSRAVWTISEFGREIDSEDAVRELVRADRAEREKARREAKSLDYDQADDGDQGDDQDWTEQLLRILRQIEPDAFERLCQRVLRESGFTKVEVTGRSGDGGIDGAGVLRVNLLSFHVRFQSKRYTGSVGAPEIRDFRGAMVGRADKGLVITTGRYTKEAEREAVRDGAPAIDLIDGIDLCYLLKDLCLGVQTETVEKINPVLEFFQNL